MTISATRHHLKQRMSPYIDFRDEGVFEDFKRRILRESGMPLPLRRKTGFLDLPGGMSSSLLSNP